jgi:L-seryl-tRNA(Ser) seleniumtransferase
VSGEERVSEVLEAGVDCVTMSGDKLLGGLQAGIIVGRKKFLERLRDNPLRRAVRVDKVTIAALQSLMRSYLFDADPAGAIPMLGQSTGPAADLRKRADNIIANLPDGVRSRYDASAEDDSAAIGGGSFAGRQLPSAAVTFRCPTEREAVRLERRLRTSKGIPVIARIKGREVRINLRTILPSEDGELVAAIEAALHDKR